MPEPILVKIKRFAHASGVPLPTRMTQHAAGFDLAAAVTDPLVLQPGDIKLIPCGFAMAVPHGYEAQVRPRSGLSSKHGVTMVSAPFTIERGMRIAQMLILPVPRSEIVEVKELDETARGEGGFGHTGH